MFILLSGCDNQNCAEKYLLRILLRWVCSWLQLIFWPKNFSSILYYGLMPTRNKFLVIGCLSYLERVKRSSRAFRFIEKKKRKIVD